MPFDSLVASPGRLRILTALAEETPQEFVALRRRTELTDGNLSTHAKRLQSAGLVQIRKAFRATKPVTTLELTLAGREALERHARGLLAVLDRHRALAPVGAGASATFAATAAREPEGDDWVD